MRIPKINNRRSLIVDQENFTIRNSDREVKDRQTSTLVLSCFFYREKRDSEEEQTIPNSCLKYFLP